MNVIKEEFDTPSDLETLAGDGIVDHEEKNCLRDVKTLGPNVHITSSGLNEGHHSSCVGSTVPDLSTVTVKLETGNADGKGCNVANHNASGPSPSIPSYSGESDEFKFSTSNTSDSITMGQHKPMSPARKTIDDENWIKKEPCSPTDSSLTLSVDTIVIHSIVDDVVSGNADLENDIAGKPLYSNDTPSVDSDFKTVKDEPTEKHLAEQQSGSNKPTVDEIQIAELMSGKLHPKVIIQKLESNSSWMRNGCKNNVKSCNAKKTLPDIDPDTSSLGQKRNFVCRICLKKYFLCTAVKKHIIQKHPESRDLCALVMKKDSKDSDNDSQLVWFCPRKCNYLTSERNAVSEHLVTGQCQKPDLLPHCYRADNGENLNSLGPFKFDEDHGGDANAEELNLDTLQTGQALSIAGKAFEHEMQTVEQEVHKCRLCCSVFSTNLLLECHMKDCHKEQPVRTHTEEKQYKCGHCGKSFKRNDNLHVHMRTHTGEKLYKCTLCNKSFAQNGDLHTHIRTHTGEKAYKCTLCNKSFDKNENLLRHMRTHTGEKPYKCTLCNKCFSQNGNLHHHMRTHTGEKPYKCTLCNKSFRHRGNLQQHMRTHIVEKPYKCTLCNKSFGENHILHRHMRTHTGEKPYKCTLCNKSFGQSRSRHRHMRTHTGEKPCKCTLCNKSFSENRTLRRHIRAHTGEKPYKCTLCNKSFGENRTLRRHIRTHTGEKPYKCTLCNKSYSQSGSLHQHMRTHTGEKPYKCGICNKSFYNSSSLHRHMRTHTGEKLLKLYNELV